MNIHSAAKYMNQGYRVRRPNWDAAHFLLINKYGDIEMTHLLTHCKLVNSQIESFTIEASDSLLDFKIDDLLAEDWELVK